MSLKACLNCSQESDADYCPACGQSMSVKISTVWHFISETLDVIYNFDSKIWRSLLPLLFQPGKLTNEYIAGRRVHYLPPFRLYLVFSILFFLVAAVPDFQGFENFSAEERDELIQDLEDSGIAINEFVEDGRDQVSQVLQDAELFSSENNINLISILEPSASLPDGVPNPEPFELALGNAVLTEAGDCTNILWSDFLGERLGARALNACQETLSDNGVTLIQSFIDSLPIMMFVSLPLLAVFMKLLYLFKNRKYVEHLMFLFHTLSFLFLVVILNISIIKLSSFSRLYKTQSLRW